MPASLDTVIMPEADPSASGSKIIRLLPSSSIVVVKSVPLIPILAVGVWISILFLLTSPNLPDVKRAVPIANFITILDLVGFGS